MMKVNTQISNDVDPLWRSMRDEALQASEQQPLMASFFHANLLNHTSFAAAISSYLSNHLATDTLPAMMIRDVFEQAMTCDSSIEKKMRQDLLAHYTRDPACDQHITPFLYFKGYHAIQSYRLAHCLWQQKRTLLATYIQSRIAELFDVDIHPGAIIGGGLMVDHATGVVIGETTVIEDNVSMLHAVTLGGSGAATGKRHPTIRQGVLLSVGAKVLGNIDIGEGVKIGAGSVVLESMPAHATVVGVPAKVVGKSNCDMPALEMDHQLEGDSEG
ncbi:MAG: serine O-acetyltransferase [Candidatus Endobugula sp.]|jgi:serine O-acetyltransferase